MTIRLRKACIIVLTVLILVTGCQGTEVLQLQQNTLITEDLNGVDINKLSHYTIDLEFNPQEATIKASQKIDYRNNQDISLQEVYLHLYPNSYRSMETAPFPWS